STASSWPPRTRRSTTPSCCSGRRRSWTRATRSPASARRRSSASERPRAPVSERSERGCKTKRRRGLPRAAVQRSNLVHDLEVGVDRTVAGLLLRRRLGLRLRTRPAGPAGPSGRRRLLVERLRGLHPGPRQLVRGGLDRALVVGLHRLARRLDLVLQRSLRGVVQLGAVVGDALLHLVRLGVGRVPGLDQRLALL